MRLAIIGAFIFLIAIIGILMSKVLNNSAISNRNPILETSQLPTSAIPATLSPTASVKPTMTPVPVAEGRVEGKLCYPSQFLPQGSIDAKNMSTQAIVSQSYPGSQNGGKSTYSVALPEGTYIFRYKAGTNADAPVGFHTETCKTGIETTCAATNARVQVQIKVTAGETTSNVDLCDFYYDTKNPPAF